MEKAGWKADCVKSVENRKFQETKEEKRQFIHDSFQLNVNEISNADKKIKEVVIKLFLDNFEVLASHLSQYGETEVLEIKFTKFPGQSHINLEWDHWIQIRRRIMESNWMSG